ncbi:MAG: Na+-driven multidrug efflux pump [Anaerocolumna sp.]|nr:Na+-driven multidrug efflux pump [Anaerocolumna sp.]
MYILYSIIAVQKKNFIAAGQSFLGVFDSIPLGHVGWNSGTFFVKEKIMEKKYYQIFMKYVSLNVLGMIGLSCYILADTFFVAKGLGSNGLTALNLSISIYSFIHGTGLMIGIGGATSFAILKALKKSKEGSTVFTNAAIIGLIAGVIYMFIGIFLSQDLSKLLGADEATLPLTNVYLKTLLKPY